MSPNQMLHSYVITVTLRYLRRVNGSLVQLTKRFKLFELFRSMLNIMRLIYGEASNLRYIIQHKHDIDDSSVSYMYCTIFGIIFPYLRVGHTYNICIIRYLQYICLVNLLRALCYCVKCIVISLTGFNKIKQNV